MTCIAGFLENNIIHLGADSAGTAGDDISIRSDKKIFKLQSSYKDNVIIAFTSSFRMGQILQFSNNRLINYEDNNDDFSFEFMVTKFIPRLITLYSESGYDKKYDDGEKKGGSFIVASKDKLYGIDNDFQIAEHLDNYIAMGSGDTVSYGVLYALSITNSPLPPEDKMKIIIGASCYFKSSVAPPIHYMNTRDGALCKLQI